MINISAEVNNILINFKSQLGNHYQKYANHVCRVVHHCLTMDPDPANFKKYIVAAVFHDIGIWTHNTIDYLDPSAEVATKYLASVHYDVSLQEILLMIKWHHKTTSYRGVFETAVNTFRKADWLDVSFGLIRFGEKRFEDREISIRYPNLGFHRFLIRKLFLNLFRNPRHPLPMFRI